MDASDGEATKKSAEELVINLIVVRTHLQSPCTFRVGEKGQETTKLIKLTLNFEENKIFENLSKLKGIDKFEK